ncbi:aldo/keto reductase [candidate division KSB1 bacterium]|nr:aldo/keto reductase [candidate division KSB1 bacterium]
MLTRPYGSTGLDVSAIGFGGMRFRDQVNIDACVELMHAAYAHGINYFDTAPGYGKSEEIFGHALPDMLKSRTEKPFYVSTKTTQSDPSEIRREVETSLKLMRLETIDFYHVWCLLSWDMYERRKAKGVLQTFEKLRDEGLINHITVSTHMPGNDVVRLMNDYAFEGILLGYSAMNFKYREPGIQAAADLGRGVVVMNPLGGGLIPQHPERFGFVRTREDENVIEGALRFLIDDPRITISLVGFRDVHDLKDVLSAMEGYEPIAASEIERIRDNVKEAFDQLCTGCQYCDECPEGIPVPKLMDAYNHYHLSNSKKELQDRLKWHWGIMPDDPVLQACTACGTCEDLCTQHLPIIERIQEISQT